MAGRKKFSEQLANKYGAGWAIVLRDLLNRNTQDVAARLLGTAPKTLWTATAAAGLKNRTVYLLEGDELVIIRDGVVTPVSDRTNE